MQISFPGLLCFNLLRRPTTTSRTAAETPQSRESNASFLSEVAIEIVAARVS